MLTTILIAAIVLAVIYLIRLVNFKQSYWKRLNIPYLPYEFLLGNIRPLISGKLTVGEIFESYYHQFKARGIQYGGVYGFTRPIFIPVDNDLIRKIFSTDFGHFMNHGLFNNKDVEPLNQHLFNMENQEWRDMRIKMTPTFTSGKMKMMFEKFVTCSEQLKVLLADYETKKEAFDVKDVLARFTTDIIGSCAFGIECNCLEDPDVEFRKYGKEMFIKGGLLTRIKVAASQTVPHFIIRGLGIRVSNVEVEKFFMNVVDETVAYREKNNIYRKDFMHMMIQLKNLGEIRDNGDLVDATNPNKKPSLTKEEFAAQLFVFFQAGFETSSSAMAFALYELSQNAEVQNRLRKEILEVLGKHDGKLTYAAVMEMKYLNKVIDETMRKHPPIPMLPRVCNKDYELPDGQILKAGTKVNIPVLGIHNDPEYYPDPEQFKPERFDVDAIKSRPSHTYLPFGDGPRMCIGLRFGLLQAKVGLIAIIQNYEVTLSPKMELPFVLDKTSFVKNVEGGMWLNISKIN